MSNPGILISITEGWTAELGPFRALADGDPINLDGYTISLKLHDGNGDRQTFGGSVRLDADQITNPGKWYFTPTASTFVAGGKYPYRVHLQVTDTDGKIAFFPNGQPYDIAVWPA